MEHVVVVDELHVAGLQVHQHVVRRGRRPCATTACSASRCSVGEPGRLGVALRRPDVRRDAAHEEPVLPLGEHRHEVVRLAVRRLLAAEVVRERVVQRGGQVGPLGRRGGCGSAPSWRPPTGRRLRPFSRHISPTRSEPSQWNGSAMPPSSLPRAVGSSTPLFWSVTSPSTWPCLFCGPRQAEVRADRPSRGPPSRPGCRRRRSMPRSRTKPRPLMSSSSMPREPVLAASGAGSRPGRARARRRTRSSAWRSAASSSASSASSNSSVQVRLVGDVGGRPLALRLEDREASRGHREHLPCRGRPAGPRTKRPGRAPVASPSA